MFKSNKISSKQIQKIIKCFVEDIPATKVASIFELNRKTVDKYYIFLRNLIVEESLKEALFYGVDKAVEFSFPKIIIEKENLLSHKKIFVLTIQEKKSKIFLISQGLLPRKDLEFLLKKEEITKSFLYFKEWQCYSAVIIDGYAFYPIHSATDNISKRRMNIAKNFWAYAKRRFVIYNGVAQHMYGTFIKNSEFRFNHRHEDLYTLILALLAKKGHSLKEV